MSLNLKQCSCENGHISSLHTFFSYYCICGINSSLCFYHFQWFLVAFTEFRWWNEASTQHHGSRHARSEHVSLWFLCNWNVWSHKNFNPNARSYWLLYRLSHQGARWPVGRGPIPAMPTLWVQVHMHKPREMQVQIAELLSELQRSNVFRGSSLGCNCSIMCHGFHRQP